MSLKTGLKIRTLRLTSKIHVLIKWKACNKHNLDPQFQAKTTRLTENCCSDRPRKRRRKFHNSAKINILSLPIFSLDFDKWLNSSGHGRKNVTWGGCLYPNSFSKREVCLWMGREMIIHKQSDLRSEPAIDDHGLRQAKRFLPWGIPLASCF